MPRFWRFVATFTLALFMLGTGLFGGIYLDRQLLASHTQTVDIPSGAVSDFKLMSEAWKLIQNQYVDHSNLQPSQLVYGAISGMVQSLGDTGHSRFLTPKMVETEKQFDAGEYQGIGAEVEMKDGHAIIVTPFDGSPAQQAGVRPGDIILRVDGVDMEGLPLEAVVEHVMGPAGTTVQITFQDPQTGQIRELTIQRAHIQLHNVTWQMLPGTSIAYLRVSAFSQGVTDNLRKAMEEIRNQHAMGIVLDLRNNPGGLLDEAVGAASQFLKDGNVLLVKNAQGAIKDIPVKKGGLATDLPLVVLVNQGSASASEIVAGALQDSHRATLVGEQTFGTGTVLNQFSLPDSSALLLATEEWLTPSGRTIWHKGISPDETLALAQDQSPLTTETVRSMTATQLFSSQDTQLLRAVQILAPSASVPAQAPGTR